MLDAGLVQAETDILVSAGLANDMNNLQKNKQTNKQTRRIDCYDDHKDGKRFGAYTIISSKYSQKVHKIENRRRKIMANKLHISEKSRMFS